jgi:DNA polymerase-3 subunit gamma/tau
LELLAARLLLPGGEAGVGMLAARLDAMERRVAALPVHTTSIVTSSTGVLPQPATSEAPTATAAPSKPRKLSEVAPSTAAAAAPAVPAVDADPVVVDLAAASESPVQAAPKAAPPAPPVAPPAAKAAAPTSGVVPVDLESIRTLWPAVLEAVKNTPAGGRTAWTVFADSAPSGVNGDELVVALPQQGSYTVARSRNLDAVLASAVQQVVRRPLRIELILDQGAKAPTAATPAAQATAEAKPGTSARARAEESVAAEVPVDPVADAPSFDDEDAEDALRGIELAKQALGGVVIAEVDLDA